MSAQQSELEQAVIGCAMAGTAPLNLLADIQPRYFQVPVHQWIWWLIEKVRDMMEEDDELINQAIEIIRQTHRASTSSLQRRLRIGYTRAARLMDVLEERGVVGPAQGSDPREILIDLDGEIPQNTNELTESQQ